MTNEGFCSSHYHKSYGPHSQKETCKNWEPMRKPITMVDTNNGHASGLPHPQNENCSTWECKEAL